MDRLPVQMIAYQLGWMQLILSWENQERQDDTVITPAPNYKWNNLGGLYKSFYAQHEACTLAELSAMFADTVQEILRLIDDYTDIELFHPGGRKWASSTPANWPIWKWIHINTVAPFKTFQTKIRKWKKLNTADRVKDAGC